MDSIRGDLVFALGWTTLYVSVSAGVVVILLRALRISSPGVHRLAWTCVILQAWLVYPLTIPLEIASSSRAPAARPLDTGSAGSGTLPAEAALAALPEEWSHRPFDGSRAAMPSAVPAEDRQRTSPDRGGWLALVWLCGAAVPAAWYGVRYARFVRAVPLGRPPERRDWRREWTGALREQGIRRGAELRMTESFGPLLCYVPFVYRVLVPRPLWVQLDRGDRLAILRHELAHLARGDLWKSAAVRVLALPQWFNPLVWWAVRRFDEAGEWACDDLAKGGRPEEQVGYAKTLVRLGDLVSQTPAGAAGARGGSLSKRVHRIIHTCFTEDSAMKKGFVYLILVGLTAVHGVRVELVAEERQGPESAREVSPTVPRNVADVMPADVPRDGAMLYWIAYDVLDLIRPNAVDADFELLIEQIQADVAPERWGEEKGRIAASPANLSLVVQQTKAVHEELADWFQANRRTKELQVSGLAPYIIEPPDVLFVHAHKVVPQPPYELDVFDVLLIHVQGALEEHPIAEAYSVQPDGSVDLGPAYGRVNVVGLMARQAEIAIDEQLRQHVEAPEASVSVAASAAARQIRGKHLVRPDGTIDFGTYGSVYVAGMTIPQAEAAVMLHLSESLQDPVITVDVLASNSKVYYVIRERAAGGDNLLRQPITGNETVLDAIAAAGGIERASEKEIYISRPKANGVGVGQILPVDWDAITRDADLKTNHALLPGDRIFIRDKSINRELVDLTRLGEEIESQRRALDELESKLHERLARLGLEQIEQIIRAEPPGPIRPEEQSDRATSAHAGAGDPSATVSVSLSGPLASIGAFEEPTSEEVRASLFAARPDLRDERLVLEKTAGYSDEPRSFPVVGRAQLHHFHFRGRVPAERDAGEAGRTVEVHYAQLVMLGNEAD